MSWTKLLVVENLQPCSGKRIKKRKKLEQSN